jgi:hypothetical protein
MNYIKQICLNVPICDQYSGLLLRIQQLKFQYKCINYWLRSTSFLLFFTCDSYGKKAMLISLSVLIFLAARDLQISLNISSGQTKQVQA